MIAQMLFTGSALWTPTQLNSEVWLDAATQEVDFTSIETERWDIPRQLEDGKWAITSPNEELE